MPFIVTSQIVISLDLSETRRRGDPYGLRLPVRGVFEIVGLVTGDIKALALLSLIFLIIYNYTFIKPPIGFSSAKIQIINQLQDNLPMYLVVCEIIRTFAVANVYNC